MKRIPAIKRYFERKDEISPFGGRLVTMDELKELRKLSDAGLTELGKLACKELGEPFEE